MRKKVGYALLIVMLFTAMVSLSSCKKKNQTPPKQMVYEALLASLPPYLSLENIELESIPTGPESAKVNFKAIVTPKEDLYEVDREVEGTPTIILLKVTQATGAKASFYGFFEASRTMDLWTLGTPQIGVGLQQLGSPRGAFPPHSYVTGSGEVDAVLKERAAKAAEEERKQKEQEEKDKQAKIAREKEIEEEKAQQQKKEEEYRQKLIQATAEGTGYIGTISYGDRRQRLRLVFTEQKGFLIRAEASNPDNRGVKQTFTGEIVFAPKPEEGRPDVAYPIVLSPIDKRDFPNNTFGVVWGFYSNGEGSLKLSLVAVGATIGLDGEANMGWGDHYTIRLQREDAKVEPEVDVTIPPIRPDKNDENERSPRERPRPARRSRY